MNLFQLATRGVDLGNLPDEEAPRQGVAFEPSTNGGKFSVPADLNDAFEFAAKDFNIDPDVLRAVAYAESRFHPDVVSGKVRSKTGATGLMQFMPETAQEYGIDPLDPVQSIFGAAAYLRKSLDKFDGDYGKAVASYNAGPNRKDFDASDWDARMPAETQGYLRTVFTAADQLKSGKAERPLPQGVAPSKAGAGRGVVNPTLGAPVTDTGDETARLAARYKAPDAPQQGGFIQSVGDFFKPAPTSVLESYKPTAAEQQAANAQRLRYGAGPIKGDVLVAANEVASGNATSRSSTVNAVAKQMQERGDTFTGYAQSKNTPILKEGARDAKAAEFRSAGEWAVDSIASLAQGSVSIPLLPASIIAPGGDTAKTLRSWRDAWSEQESDVLKAQRVVLKERIQSEEGFAGKYATTVLELVTNPALGLSEAIKQVPNYLAVIGTSRLAAGAVGTGFNAIEKSSPTLALANALSSGAVKGGAQATAATAGGMAASVVMTSGDAAGDVYETLTDPNKTPKKVWEQNEDYQALIKQGLSHKAAVMRIAEAKARFAAVVVAPLGLFGFMGAESALATKGIAGLAASFGPKAAAKTFGKEIVGENIEEGGTKWGGNVVTSTVDPRVKWDEGVAEAAATATVTSAPMAGLAARSQLSAPPAQTQDPRNGLIAAGLLDPQTYDGGIVGAAGTANPLLEQLKRKPAPTVESQPTTPTVPPSAPTAPAADATQAVDNIAALLKQTEAQLDGTATQATPVPAGQQTADAGAAPVAQGSADTSGGLAPAGEVVATGQSEQAVALTVPEKGSAVIPSVETGQSMAQRLTTKATPEQEQTQADTVVAEKAKPAPAYTPAIPQPGQAEAIVGKAVESARKNADLADERMYSVDALQRIAAHPQANDELKAAATNEVQRRAGIEQVKQQQFEARRSGTVLSIPDAPPLRPLSVERGIEIAKASRERKLLPQEQGYMDALKAEIGDKAFDLVTRAGKAPFMTTMTERKFDLPRLLEQNNSALTQWDTAHNPAQKPTAAPKAAPTPAPAPTGIGAEMAALKARSQPAVKMNLAPALQAAQAPAAAPTVKQDLTIDAASGVATNTAQAGGKGKKGKQKQEVAVAAAPTQRDKTDAPAIGQPSKMEKEAVNALMPFNIIGNKSHLLAESIGGLIETAARTSRRVIDAFGGAGTYTHYLRANGIAHDGDILNEFDSMRASAHRQIAKNPEAVKAAVTNFALELDGERKRLGLNKGDLFTIEADTSRKALANWVRSRLEAHVEKEPISGKTSVTMRDSPELAGMYLVLQKRAVNSMPVQAERSKKSGEFVIPGLTFVIAKGGAKENGGKVKLGGAIGLFSPEKLAESINAKIDSGAASRTAGLDVRTGDGWALIAAEARDGDLATVDTSYLNKTDIESGKTDKTQNYSGDTEEDADPNTYKSKVEKYLLPAWDRGAKLLITNNWDDDVAAYLSSQGFDVRKEYRKGAKLDERSTGAAELIAINFDPATGRNNPRRVVVAGQSGRGIGGAATGQDQQRGIADAGTDTVRPVAPKPQGQGDAVSGPGRGTDAGIKASRAPSTLQSVLGYFDYYPVAFPIGYKDSTPRDIEIGIADIVPTQDSLKGSAVEQYARDDGGLLPEVVLDKSSGRYILLDGHHRVAGAVVRGDDTVQVTVVGSTERPTAFSGMKSDMQADWRASFPGDADRQVLDVVTGEQVGQGAETKRSVAKQSPRTPVSTLRAAITKAYGNLLARLEGKGLVSLTQTEEQAIEAAAQARVDQNGGDVEAIKESLRKSVLASQRAWHGTPHRGIDKFSTDKIGTGEGAQAYGWGLYYASRKAIAEHYRKILSGKDTPIWIDAKVNGQPAADAIEGFLDEQEFDKPWKRDDARQTIVSHLGFAISKVTSGKTPASSLSSILKAVKKTADSSPVPGFKASATVAARFFESRNIDLPGVGQLYEVDIPNDSDMLLWDKPLSEQPESVRDAAMKAARKLYPRKDQYDDADLGRIKGEVLYQGLASYRFGGPKVASQYLASLGIKGIKYLDGTSRNAGEGSYNYVVFSGDDVQIVDVKYSKDGNLEGFFDPATGKSFLIADNLTAESAPATLMHEVGIHMAAEGKFGPMFDRAASLLKMARDNEFIQRVQSRMDEAGETSNEEAAAYIVTEYEKDRTNAPASVKQWIKDFIADVRAWLFNKGVLLKAGQLTVADIAAVARANANRMARGDGQGDVRYSKTDNNGMLQTKNTSPAVTKLNKVMRGAGWEIEFIDLDMTGEQPKVAIRVNRDDGRFLIAKVDSVGRASFETFQRERSLRMDVSTKGRRPLSPMVDDTFLGRQRFEGARSMLRGMVSYLVDNASEPVALSDMKSAWAGAMAAPVQQDMKALEADTDGVKNSKQPTPDKREQTETPEFKRWFAGSKVVDADGKPLVVYHGTAADFSVFNKTTGGEFGPAMYFTDNPREAGEYGSGQQKPGVNVMPVYISMWYPYTDGVDKFWQDFGKNDGDAAAIARAQNAGYDGVIAKRDDVYYDNDAREFVNTGKQLTHYIVFNPTQIKSAIGNNGDFDPANPDIRRSVRGGGQQAQQNLALNTPSPAWMLPASTKTDALVYEIQDQKVDLKRTQEAIKAAGRTITEPFDARMAETLMPGRVAYRTETFLKTEVAPLMEAMAKNNVTQNQLSDYLLARHAPERNAQIAKVNPDPDMQDGGAGTNSQGVRMTTQAANDYIAALTTGKRMVLQLLANKIDAITANTRDMLVREGLEKQSTMDAWTGAYKHYVPLFKDEAVESPAHPIGSGMSVTGSASKRAMGSEGEVTNMVAHILMQREAAITRAEKNRVAMSLYGLALSNPNQEVWTTIRPNMRADKIGAELAAMGVDPVEAEQGMQGVPTIRTVNAVTGLVQETPNPMYKRLENALVVKVDGEDRVVLFNAKNADAMRMVRALKNQDGLTNFDLAGSMVGTATRYFASINTQYNPAFGMVNVVRDIGGALVNLTTTGIADKKAKVLGDIPAAMKGIARDVRGDQTRTPWSDLWVQFQEDGGRTGYRDLFIDPFKRAEAVQKDLDAMQRDGKASAGRVAHSILDLLDDFNTTLENGVRLSAYKAALDKGMSRPAAAKMARELTVDFNRKGRTGREVGPLYAFFNASVQGTARTIESLKGPAGKKIIAGGLMLGVIQSLMLAAAGFDDDEPPEFVKARAFIIPMGDKKYIAIPLQFGLNALPNTGRVITDLLLTGGKDAGKKTFNAIGEIMGSFNPLGGGNIFTAHGLLTTVAPTVADPLVDLATNTNFAGTPIGKDRADWDTRPGAKLARESTQRSVTGQVYIGISKAINAASGGNEFKKGLASPTPEQVQYVFTTAGGGLYRELEKTLNIAGLKADGFEIKSRMIPLGGRFAGEADDQDTQRSRYYRNSERLAALEAELKGFDKADDEAAVKRIETERSDEVDLLGDYKHIRQAITKLNKLAADNINDVEMLKELDAERLELMRELNDSVRKLEKRSELFKRD